MTLNFDGAKRFDEPYDHAWVPHVLVLLRQKITRHKLIKCVIVML